MQKVTIDASCLYLSESKKVCAELSVMKETLRNVKRVKDGVITKPKESYPMGLEEIALSYLRTGLKISEEMYKELKAQRI